MFRSRYQERIAALDEQIAVLRERERVVSERLANWPPTRSAHPVSSDHPNSAHLRQLAAETVRACLPVLPIVGGPRMGYTVGGNVRYRDRAEVERAAQAVCDLHRALRQ